MKQKPTNPAKINLKSIKAFIQGYTRQFSDSFGLLPQHKKEQVIWRESKAADCVANKACLFCGCEMPAKLYSDECCTDPQRRCYPDMMDLEDWECYKKANNIEVKID